MDSIHGLNSWTQSVDSIHGLNFGMNIQVKLISKEASLLEEQLEELGPKAGPKDRQTTTCHANSFFLLFKTKDFRYHIIFQLKHFILFAVFSKIYIISFQRLSYSFGLSNHKTSILINLL